MNDTSISINYAHAAFVPPVHRPDFVDFLPGLAAAVIGLVLIWRLRGWAVRTAGLALGRLIYRVRPLGADRMPARGGVLLVANHVSYVDAIILSLASPRPVRFLAHEGFFQRPVLGFLLKAVGCIPVSDRRSKDAIRAAVAHLRAGEVVGIFPEGQLTRTGSLLELKRGWELIVRQAGCPVLPVVMDGLWGSIFSFAGGRYFYKWPKRSLGARREVRVAFGECLEPEMVDSLALRQVMSELGAVAFAARPELALPLPVALVRALRRDPWRVQIVDYGMGGRQLRRVELLATAVTLGSNWRQTLAGNRVGVVLPPGIAGAIVNLALIFAGKTPVNLNPTGGSAAFANCVRRAGILTIITAPAVQKRFSDLAWPDDVIDAAAEIDQLSRQQIGAWIAATILLPTGWCERLMLGSAQQVAPGFLLFTSGSSGEPKGVEFSGRNLLTNAAQVAELNLLRRDDVFLCSLPLFHSFGLTVGLLVPLLNGQRIVTTPSPFDYDRIAKAAACGRATTLLATPAFLEGYVRKIPAEAFASLRCIVTGAEKLPADLAVRVFEKFRTPVLEGYGLTEASPGVALSQLDPERGLAASQFQTGHRPGSVGRFVPGLAWRLVDPESARPVAGNEGMLAIRGSNVITSYLGGLAPAERFRDGWFLTGDIVSIDVDGFVRIAGRTSRFSKIGGEMVPHGVVEEAVVARFGSTDTRSDCVLGVDDGAGEELVLLTTRDLDRERLRQELRRAGLPNLWIPRRIIVVEELPILASGKLDLAACLQLAENTAELAAA